MTELKATIPGDNELADLARRVGKALVERGLTMATAESCTGGWIAKTATDLAGSSDWFDCGIVAYSNAAKQALLGVQLQTLETHGAVSCQTAIEMVEGALMKSGAGVAVAVTGIAGPGGGTESKPVGTVWLAWKRQDGNLVTKIFSFDGNRDAVRRQTVEAAWKGLLERVGD